MASAFDFATATRIAFGPGKLLETVPAASAMGKRFLLVTGSSPERAEPLAEALARAGLAAIRFPTAGEPTVELVRRGSGFARQENCDAVIALGGGSAIDAAKAIAAMLTNPGDPLDYLEVIGAGKPITRPSAPFIAIPTTAGTGSEVTRNAVLGSAEHGVKASLRSPLMLPAMAVIDPELTYGLPPAVTAATGLDALTQVIEPYVSARANPMTDLFCVDGIRRAAVALPRAWENGADREARIEMSWVSLLGGLSLANAGLGAAHGFAAPIGGQFPAPHGAVCAALLPHVMEVNIRALRSREPANAALRRYETVARLLTGNSAAAPEAGAEWVAAVCRKLRIPPLREYGVTGDDLQDLAGKAAKASSMKANPIALTGAELMEIVQRAL
jgi:alcohol dehydrogenase class IV